MGAEALSEQHAAIDEVINYIHHNLYDPLPLAQLARYVAYSPFHFSRLFKERLGLTPQYYVSSLRLQKAKELLLRTSLSIREVGLEIGQQSLGTFTSRFTERVGVTPARFRDSEANVEDRMRSLQRLTDWRDPSWVAGSQGTLTGTIRIGADVPSSWPASLASPTPSSFSGVILVGLFPKPIPEGVPLYGTLLPGPGEFRFTNVRPGVYYLMATAVPWNMHSRHVLLPQSTLRTRSHAPILVGPQTSVPHLEVDLYPPRLDDPPILISLPLLMNRFLHRVTQHRNR